MKRTAIATLVAATLVIAVTGCSSSGSGSGTEPTDDSAVTGGIALLTNQPTAFVSALQDGAKQQAEDLGISDDFTIYSASDAQQDVANIQSAIAAGAKAIAIQPTDATAVGPALEQAIADGVCVIAIYNNILGADDKTVAPGAKAYIGWDGQKAAAALAKSMADKLGGNGNVLVISGPPGNLSSNIWTEAALDEWSTNSPGVTQLGETQYGDFDNAKVRSITQDAIQRYGDEIDAIFVTYDENAAAAAEVVANSDLAGDVVIGSFGGSEVFIKTIEAGDAWAAVPFLPYSAGQSAVQLAHDCIGGDTEPVLVSDADQPAVAALEPAGFVVTADNIADFTPQY